MIFGPFVKFVRFFIYNDFEKFQCPVLIERSEVGLWNFLWCNLSPNDPEKHGEQNKIQQSGFFKTP